MNKSPDDTLQARLYARLEANPERRAITFYNSRGEFSWQTYEQFYERATGHAAQLAEHGLSQGEVCIIVLPSGELSATLIFGTLLLGAVPLLVAPPTLQKTHSSLTHTLKHIISKTKPRVVVCDDSMLDMQAELQAHRPNTHFLFGESAFTKGVSAIIPQVTPATTDIVALQLTSGTTGIPRVCMEAE